jgi:hypothetical protein
MWMRLPQIRTFNGRQNRYSSMFGWNTSQCTNGLRTRVQRNVTKQSRKVAPLKRRPMLNGRMYEKDLIAGEESLNAQKSW